MVVEVDEPGREAPLAQRVADPCVAGRVADDDEVVGARRLGVPDDARGPGEEGEARRKGAPKLTPPRPKAERGNPLQAGATMPGKIVAVEVGVGDAVAAGDTLIIAEAMKMETAITAATAGRVAEVLVQRGETVAAGDLLVRLET